MNTNEHESADEEAKSGELNPWPRFGGGVRLTVETEYTSLYSCVFVSIRG
jgi:hypothetical protein